LHEIWNYYARSSKERIKRPFIKEGGIKRIAQRGKKKERKKRHEARRSQNWPGFPVEVGKQG